MKRSLGAAELPVSRARVPATSDDSALPAPAAPQQPASAPLNDTHAAQHAPMAFPGPFAFVRRPAVMQDDLTEPGPAGSVSGEQDGLGPGVTAPALPGPGRRQVHSEPAPDAGASMTSAACTGTGIGHPSVSDDNPHRFPPLILAAFQGRLAEVELLLQDPALDIDQIDRHSGQTALMAASFANKPGMAACLLAAGAKVNIGCGERRRTALMVAALWGYVEVVKTLLTRRDIALDQTDAKGRNALFLAASKNKYEVVACLLAAGANVNFRNGDPGHTALGVAAIYGHVEVVRRLLACKGVVLNQPVSSGMNVLVLAAFNNRADVVACLLAAGESTSVADASGRAALSTAIANRHAAVVEVLMQYGAVLPGFKAVDPAQSRSAVAFAVTLADLDADRASPAGSQDNRLGLAAPHSLEDPPGVIDGLLAVFESQQDLQQWQRATGIRMACALPVLECIATLASVWPVLADGGRAANAQQKRLACAAALSRLSVLTAEGKALAPYRAAGISAAGLERLSAVAMRQIEKMIAVSEQVLTSMGSVMLDKLVQACLASTNPSHEVETAALNASLVSAGWLPPLAQAIALSWKSAMAALESEPVPIPIPAGSTMKQITQLLCESIERKAPPVFAQEMQRELRAQTVVAALRTWIGDAKSVEGLDLLFQVQCDQLRQYCEQIMGAG